MINILFVDDEPLVKITFRKLIDWENSDYRLVETVSNGAEALQYIKNHPIDIVITDLKMPVMDGLQLIIELKKLPFTGPILVLSNYSDFNLVRDALTQGATDYLLKVTMTGESLLTQLSKMSSLIQETNRTNIENTKNNLLFDNQKKQMFLSNLKDYLLDTSNSITNVPLETNDLKANPFLPAYLFTIYFSDVNAPAEKLKTALSYASDVIAEMFETNSEIIILKIHHNELACMIPYKHFTETRKEISKVLQLLLRRMNIYFSIPCSIFYSKEQYSYDQLKESYYKIINSYPFLFYGDKLVLNIESIGTFQENLGDCYNEFISTIEKAFRENNLDCINEKIKEFIKFSKKENFLPMKIKFLCIQALSYINFSNNYPNPPINLTEEISSIQHCYSIYKLEDILCEAFHLLYSHSEIGISKYKKEIQDVIRYINHNYTDKITLDDLAISVNMNSSYLCRLFKQEVGTSIFKYINNVRMEKAAQLIKENKDIYVKEIASSVGIDDPFYFTRRFKEYFGKNPKEYKS